MQLTVQQNISSGVNSLNTTMTRRPNVFNKNPNIAQMHTVELNSDLNGRFELDGNKNLIIDFSKSNIGSSLENTPNLRIEQAETSDNLMKADSKITAKKLTTLMNQYTIFNIKSLLISKFTYKTDLTIFSKVFVVFPDILVDGRFNTPYNTGSLQISGHFENAMDTNSYVFIPDSDIGVVYKDSTAEVKAFKLYISDVPNSKPHILPASIEYPIQYTNIFNCPIQVQTIDEMFYPSVVMINCSEITIVSRGYSLLYNQSYNTIRLIKAEYSYDRIPRKNTIKSNKIKKPIEQTRIKPLHPYTATAIRDLYRQALVKGESYIWVQKPDSYPSDKFIEQAYNKAVREGKSEVELNHKIYPLKSKAIDLIHDVNYYNVPINNIVMTAPSYTELISEYEKAVKNQTVSYATNSGIPLKIIHVKTPKTPSTAPGYDLGYDLTDWYNAFNTSDTSIYNWSDKIAQYLQKVYDRALHEYESTEEELAETVGIIQPSDDMNEAELNAIGYFGNDYNYIIKYSEDPIIPVSLTYWDPTNQRVVETVSGISTYSEEVLHLTDFYTDDLEARYPSVSNENWIAIDVADSTATVVFEEKPSEPVYIEATQRYIYIDIYNVYATKTSLTLPNFDHTHIKLEDGYHYYSNITGEIEISDEEPEYENTYGTSISLGYKQMQYVESNPDGHEIYIPDESVTIIYDEVTMVYHFVNKEGVVDESNSKPEFTNTFHIGPDGYEVIHWNSEEEIYDVQIVQTILTTTHEDRDGWEIVVEDKLIDTHDMNGLYCWIQGTETLMIETVKCGNVLPAEYYIVVENRIFAYLTEDGSVKLTDDRNELTLENTVHQASDDITQYKFFDIEPKKFEPQSGTLAGTIYLDENGEEYRILYNNSNLTTIKYKHANYIRSSGKLETIEQEFTLTNLFGVVDANGNFKLIIRDIPYQDNLYKTFKIGYKLLDSNNVWELNDYFYSLFKLDSMYTPVENLFKRYNDMQLRTLTPTDIISDAVDYYSPRIIKYFDNHIDNFGNNLIVKTDKAIESPTVIINDKKYISNLIANNISQLNYQEAITEPFTIKNASINVQMTIELQ
jgi:hypothetical protein